MPTFKLGDPSWLKSEGHGDRRIDSAVVPRDQETSWALLHSRPGEGRAAGVDLVAIENGRFRFAVVPTRGMGLWRAWSTRDEPIGWRSPVADGPIHPSLVNLAAMNGFGWLDGFDELMCRCGLESNGPPVDDPPFSHGLHGRIANLPARDVVADVAEVDGGELAIEGTVNEARLFGPNLSLRVRYSTRPRSNRLTVRDTITNHADSPAKVVLLYHWNFGPPPLEAGGRFSTPIGAVVPQTARAAEGIGHFGTYGPPQPGFAEQVYLFELMAADGGDQTLAMLCNRAADRGVVLRFSTTQLPCFTLWKCERGLGEGYVTGLEPGTNYPNPRPFERDQGRFVELEPGGTFVAETVFEVLSSAEEVASVEAEVEAIQRRASPRIEARPIAPWSPG